MTAHLSVYHMKVTSGSCSTSEAELFNILQSGSMSDIFAFLEHNSDIRQDCRNDSGYTLLGVVARNGLTTVAHHLIKVGHSVNEADFYGQTPLQYAAEHGQVNMLNMLLENGANVNWMDTNKDGLSALHLATLQGKSEIVQILIDAHCDLNVKDINGVSALHCAVANSNHDISKMLLRAHARVNVRGIRNQRTPVFIAAEIGDLDMLQELLKHGGRVNVKDEYGMSPLCAVCIQNNSEVASCLLKAGSKVNVPDHTGSLPIHYSARAGNLDLMEWLIEKGSDLNCLNKYFESPLHMAVHKEHIRTVKLLVQSGCDVNVSDSHGLVTPLHVAVNTCTDVDNFSTMLEYLIEGGLEMDTMAFISMATPLYHAINLDKPHFAVLLLQHGSDPNADCPFDITVLQKACEKDDPELTETLLHCPLDWARETWLDTDIHTSGINSKLLAGYAKNIPMVLLKKIDLYIRILEVRQNAPSLMDLCRWQIRRSMGRGFHVKLEATPLPIKLQEFVLLKAL